MYNLKLWYNVMNCGDGSVHVRFFESRELAELDDELQEEGFAESTTDYVEVHSDSYISTSKNIVTKEKYLEDLKEQLEWLTKSPYKSQWKIEKLQETINKLENE